MTLFRNKTHEQIWIDRWCHTCYQPNEAARRLHNAETMCPILGRALASDRKPVEWDRMPRAQEMDHTIKCNSYQDKPPIVRRGTTETGDVPMFDLTPEQAAAHLHKIEGWPEKPTPDGTDHA
jgi:hypothetical protein